jgi:hypothetical protein
LKERKRKDAVLRAGVFLDKAESEMSEMRGTRRSENPEVYKPHPGFDAVRQEDMHRERDRQREIQRRYRTDGGQDREDIDVGSNERF